MIRALIFVLFLTVQAQAATVYPCDLTPAPVMCFGVKKMMTAYTGSAFDLYNPDTAATGSVGYSGDDLNTTALDAFRNGAAVNITRWYDQKNSKHLVQPITSTTGNTTLNSGVVTNIASTATASAIKMIVGPNILFNSTVTTVDGPTQVTMSEVALATGTGVPLAFTSAPHIDTLTVGNSRAVIFQGESTAGAFDYMTTPDITSLGVTAKDYSVTVVVQPSSSMYCTQSGCSDLSLGALFDFVSATPVVASGDIVSGSPTINNITTTGIQAGDVVGGTSFYLTRAAAVQTVGPGNQITMTENANVTITTPLTFARPVARAYNNSLTGVRGAWTVGDGTFEFIPSLSWVQLNPTVLTITSDSTGTKLWQDGQIRATASRSALTRTAAYLYLGKIANAMPGAYGRGFGGEIAAVIVHNVGLTENQQSKLAAALYQFYEIYPPKSKYATNLITLNSDSIGASYKTLGTYGYADYLIPTVSKVSRMQNFGVPGSTCSQNPAGGPSYANTTGLFPIATAPVLIPPNANKGRVAIFHLGGNDTFGPTLRNGTANGTTTITVADTSNLTIGDYVFGSKISSLTTITAIDTPPGTISVTPATSGSGLDLLQFIYAASGPSAIYTCVANLVTAANTAGATKSIVSTILPRNDSYFPWRDAINTLLVASVPGATVVNCAVYGILATIPGPAYADSAHLTAAGHQEMAACLLPEVNLGLQ